MGGFLCRFAHPFLSINALAKGCLQVLDEFLHARLVGWGKIFLHIHLTDRFAQNTVNGRHTALPTWAGFLGTCQDASLKVEHLFIHLVAKNAARRIENLPQEEIFQHFHRRVFQHGKGFLHRFGLTHRE